MSELTSNTSVSGGVKISRYLFALLAWLTVACVVLQTFLAGMAVFTDPIHWKHHTTFVHLFEFLPIILMILAFTGKLPNALRWQSAALFVLIFAQYFTAHFPGAGAVHPVIALLLFWLALAVARQSLRQLNRQS